MSNNDLKKTLPQNTIPTSKLTVILNNFIVNTTNHLNKLSTNVDEKLSEFDKKLNDLEIMTTLFESKLESLPDEIKSTFPPLQPCNLDDVNPNFSSNVNPIIQDEKKEEENQEQNKENQENQEEDKKEENNNEEEKKEETGAEGGEEGDNGEMSPQQELDKFLAEHGELQNIYKMLKLGVPSEGVIQKAKLNQLNMDLITQLIEIAKKLNPNIV